MDSLIFMVNNLYNFIFTQAHEIFPPYDQLVSITIYEGLNDTTVVGIEVTIGGNAPTQEIISSIMHYYYHRNSTVTFESIGVITLFINGRPM